VRHCASGVQQSLYTVTGFVYRLADRAKLSQHVAVRRLSSQPVLRQRQAFNLDEVDYGIQQSKPKEFGALVWLEGNGFHMTP